MILLHHHHSGEELFVRPSAINAVWRDDDDTYTVIMLISSQFFVRESMDSVVKALHDRQ